MEWRFLILLWYTEHGKKSYGVSSLYSVYPGKRTDVSNNVHKYNTTVLLQIVANVRSAALLFQSVNPKQERYFIYTL